jgi:hypothetical protein
VPPSAVEVVAAPPYVCGGVQEAIPENALPERVTVTGWLYQPFTSGGRSGVALALGIEISMCSGKLNVDEVPSDQVTAQYSVVLSSVL